MKQDNNVIKKEQSGLKGQEDEIKSQQSEMKRDLGEIRKDCNKTKIAEVRVKYTLNLLKKVSDLRRSTQQRKTFSNVPRMKRRKEKE